MTHHVGLAVATAFVRSRRAPLLVVTAAVTSLAVALVPLVLVEVPSFGAARSTVPVYLLPVLLSGAWTLCVVSPAPVLERFIPDSRMRVRRAAWLTTGTGLLALVAAVPAVLVHHSVPLALTLGRNALLGVAVATAAGCALSPRLSWIPPVSFSLVCWLFGTVDHEASPAVWAVANHPYDVPAAAAVSLALWLAAGARYVVGDGHTAGSGE